MSRRLFEHKNFWPEINIQSTSYVNACFPAMYAAFPFLVETLRRISFGNVATEDLPRTIYTIGIASTGFKWFSIMTSQSRATKNSRRVYINASTHVIFFQVEGHIRDPKLLFKIQNHAESAQHMGHVYPQNTTLRSFAVVSRIGWVIEHQSSEKAVIYSENKRLLYTRSQTFIVENGGITSIHLQLSSYPKVK